jgi:hypothetical protein
MFIAAQSSGSSASGEVQNDHNESDGSTDDVMAGGLFD